MYGEIKQTSQNVSRHNSSRFDMLGGQEKGGFVGWVLTRAIQEMLLNETRYDAIYLYIIGFLREKVQENKSA